MGRGTLNSIKIGLLAVKKYLIGFIIKAVTSVIFWS